MLDHGTLALRDGQLAVVLALNGQCLIGRCMPPIEVDKSNDIKVVIEFLKCLLKPGSLSRLSCCVCHL